MLVLNGLLTRARNHSKGQMAGCHLTLCAYQIARWIQDVFLDLWQCYAALHVNGWRSVPMQLYEKSEQDLKQDAIYSIRPIILC